MPTQCPGRNAGFRKRYPRVGLPSAPSCAPTPCDRINRDGVRSPSEPTEVLNVVQDDTVGFRLRSSFTFEATMPRAGFEPHHQTQGVNVPMCQSTMACRPTLLIARGPGQMFVTNGLNTAVVRPRLLRRPGEDRDPPAINSPSQHNPAGSAPFVMLGRSLAGTPIQGGNQPQPRFHPSHRHPPPVPPPTSSQKLPVTNHHSPATGSYAALP